MLPRMKWKLLPTLQTSRLCSSSELSSSSSRFLRTNASIQHTSTHCLNSNHPLHHRTILQSSDVSSRLDKLPSQRVCNHSNYHSQLPFSTFACRQTNTKLLRSALVPHTHKLLTKSSYSTEIRENGNQPAKQLRATLVPHAHKHVTRAAYCTEIPVKGNQPVTLAYSSFHDTHVTPLTGATDHVVILHGVFGSKQNWRGLGKAISRSGRKIVAVDLRNHGDSPHVPDMTYLSMAEDVRCLIEDLGLPSVSLVGHSMGGKVAMVLALTRPDLVKNLTVVDVAPNPSPTSNTFYDFATALRDFPFDTLRSTVGLPALRQAIVNSPEFSDVVSDERVRAFLASSLIITEEGEVKWKFNIEAIRDNARHIVGWPDVGPCCYPGDVLFIAGALSNYVTPGGMPAIRRYFPNARLEQVARAGHWVHAEKPQEFVAHLVRFLALQPNSS